MVYQEVISLKDGVNINIFDDYIGNQIKNSKGYYEEEVLLNFIDYIPMNGVIYDVGANIGNHTLFFTKYLKPKLVISFEPSSENFSLLDKNVKLNRLDNVVLYNVAAGLSNQKGSLEFNEINTGASKIMENESGSVDIVRIDDLDLELPNFIKIDVEGYEFQVLQGLEKSLKYTSPTIWVEIQKENYPLVDEFLSKYNYVQVDRWLDNYIYLKASTSQELNTNLSIIKNKALTRLNNKISELNIKYRNSSETINKRNKEFALLTKENNKLSIENNEIKNNILLKENELINLRDINVTYKSQIDYYQKQNKNLFLTLESKNEKLESLLTEHFNEKISLFKLKENITNELKNYMSIVTETDKENLLLKNKISEQNEDILRLNDSVRNLLNRETLLEKLKKEHQESIKNYELKLIEKDKVIFQLSEEKKEILMENEIKINIQNDLKKENHKMKQLELENIEIINKLQIELKDKQEVITKLVNEKKELIIQSIDLKTELENEIKDKIHLINKEELFTLKYEEVSSTIKKLENENFKLKQQINKLESTFEIINKKYKALKNSKLGKITLKYWSLRRKTRGGN